MRKVLFAAAVVIFIVVAYAVHNHRYNAQIKAAASKAAEFTSDASLVWLAVAKIDNETFCLRTFNKTVTVTFLSDYPWWDEINRVDEGEQVIFVFCWPHEKQCDLTNYVNFLRPFPQKIR